MCFKGKTFKSRFLYFFFVLSSSLCLSFSPSLILFLFPSLLLFLFPCGFFLFFFRSRELFVLLISKAQGTTLLTEILCIDYDPFEINNDLL